MKKRKKWCIQVKCRVINILNIRNKIFFSKNKNVNKKSKKNLKGIYKRMKIRKKNGYKQTKYKAINMPSVTKKTEKQFFL